VVHDQGLGGVQKVKDHAIKMPVEFLVVLGGRENETREVVVNQVTAHARAPGVNPRLVEGHAVVGASEENPSQVKGQEEEKGKTAAQGGGKGIQVLLRKLGMLRL